MGSLLATKRPLPSLKSCPPLRTILQPPNIKEKKHIHKVQMEAIRLK